VRIPLDSSLLSWVDYDPSRSQLSVQLRDGQRYLYFQLPPACYHQLLAADSHGAYFNRHIRNHFPYQHLSSSSPQPIVLIAQKTK
jgi:hypothetical protein